MIKMRNLFTAGILTAMIVLFLLPVSAEAQEVYSSKEDSKLSAEIERYIEERKEGTASVSLAVFNGQETAYQTQYGYANVEEQIKVDRNVNK